MKEETELDNGTIDMILEWLHKNRSPGKESIIQRYLYGKQAGSSNCQRQQHHFI